MLITYNSFEKFNVILKELFQQKNKKDQIGLQRPLCQELDIPTDYIMKKIGAIDKNNFFIYSGEYVELIRLDEKNKKLQLLNNTKIEFKLDIETITPSIKKDKIYVCLSDRRVIKIFNCDLVNGIMELSPNEIIMEDIFEGNFLKSIELSNNLLAVIEDAETYISLWNLDNYSKINQISINETIKDLLLINSDYFISSQPNSETVIFHNINNLADKKIVENINSSGSTNCLSSNKMYILVSGSEGFSLISIKHKELIQYFEMDYIDTKIYESRIKIDDNNNLYCLYSDSKYDLEAENFYFNIFNLEESIMKKIVKYERGMMHGNIDKNFDIYVLNTIECIFIIDGRIFICSEYDLNKVESGNII